MSAARFAPITGALLARKGEAQPWGAPPPPSLPQPSPAAARFAFPAEAPSSPLPPPVVKPPIVTAAHAPASHRCTIRMTAHDFQRLGIVAVKDGTTRQHLLQQALADFLAAKEQGELRACRCMAAAPCGCDPA